MFEKLISNQQNLKMNKKQNFSGKNLDRKDDLRKKNGDTLLDMCVSSLRRGHANLLCIVPILTDDPRRESGPLFKYSGRFPEGV